MTLRHLTATIHNFTTFGGGNCFQRSVAMVMDVVTAKLVIGTLTDPEDGHPYLHCWVLLGGRYIDPSDWESVGLRPVAIEDFAKDRSPRDIHIVNRKLVMDVAKRGGLSRWTLTDEPHHKFTKTLGEVLLDEAGIPYVLSDRGTILPSPRA